MNCASPTQIQMRPLLTSQGRVHHKYDSMNVGGLAGGRDHDAIKRKSMMALKVGKQVLSPD